MFVRPRLRGLTVTSSSSSSAMELRRIRAAFNRLDAAPPAIIGILAVLCLGGSPAVIGMGAEGSQQWSVWEGTLQAKRHPLRSVICLLPQERGLVLPARQCSVCEPSWQQRSVQEPS